MEQALGHDPKYIPALLSIGMTYQRMGENKNAIKMYERLLSVSNNFVPALNNIAWLYAEEGKKFEDALSYAKKAVSLKPADSQIIDTLGWVYLKKQQYNDAVKTFQKAVNLSPKDPILRYHLGFAYSKAGDKAKAKEELNNALKLSATFAGAEEAKKLLKKL